MTSKEIIEELKTMGSESVKKIWMNHGAKEPFYGVKIADMKPVQKKIKKDYKLSMELYNSGIGDAMYLAGLIADEKKMTKKDLQLWAEKATSYMLSEFTVAWVAAESDYGYEMGMKWIDDKKESIAASGWATLSGWVALQPDEKLDMKELKALLERIAKTIQDAQNRVRYAMNNFIIAVGSYVEPLTDTAMVTAKKIGTVMVNMGDTACKVPDALEYIQKVSIKGKIGKKKKTVRC